MKYYSEKNMKNIRLAFEKICLQWQHMSTKKMFGCPCYLAKGQLFAFLVTNGIVITELDQADREALIRRNKANSFQAGKRIMRNWLTVPVYSSKDIENVIHFVRKS